ncbi:hypothetical protein COB64_02540 [Candidatus Wolfebacteria bacterium]|nr:MAG: hypothetical protein COB64_02540 [Candidatus Wolfebacteria bacterium]
MILFSLSTYEYMARSFIKEGKVVSGTYSVERFTNNEISITLETSVEGQECIALGGTTPTNDELFTLLLLTHTLKTYGAKKITVITPYLSYARQDNKGDSKSVAASWIGETLKASGVDEVITIDVHSPEVVTLFAIPLISLSSVDIFAKELAKVVEEDVTLVAPDEGAVPLAESFREKLGLTKEIAYFKKTRTQDAVILSDLHGEIEDRVIIIDDLLDTGGTLIESVKKLKEGGVDKISIVVVHGLFSGTQWEELWSLGVKHIYTTDTISRTLSLSEERITVLSIESLIAEYITTRGA